MTRFSPSRRAFLETLGVSAALSPFIPLLHAESQLEAFPKRLVLFYTPHGTVLDAWKPTGVGSSFELSGILAPLARHRKKLNVLSGVNMPDVGVGAPHTKGLPLLWTGSKLLEEATFERSDGSGGKHFGWNSGPSVDQFIAQRLKPKTAFRSLELGVRSSGSHPASRMIYANARTPLEPAADPAAVFERLFVQQSDRSRRERESSLHLLHAELNRLRPRIAAADRPKLTAHVEAITSIETRLKSLAAVCQAPPLGAAVNAWENASTPAVLDRHCELVAAALACDLTRFASIQYTVGDNDNSTYPWLDITDSGHHSLTHAPSSDRGARAKLVRIYTWYADRFANLLDLLDAVPEGDGTLLDHSVVVWGSELGTGNLHSFASTPFVVAGSAGGALQTGRHLDFAGKVEHHRLLVTICRALGLEDVDQFGDSDTGQGPLSGLLRA